MTLRHIRTELNRRGGGKEKETRKKETGQGERAERKGVNRRERARESRSRAGQRSGREGYRKR